MSLDFLKWIAMLFCCFYTAQSFSQTNSLKSSIGFTENLRHKAPISEIELDSVGFPADLVQSKIFYIDINKIDLYGNKPWYSRSFKGINKKVVRGMNSEYNGDFDVFPNGKINEGNEFFINQGFKYRLLVRSTWMVHYDSNKSQGFKVMYGVAIQNIQTGRIYGYDYLQFRNNFIQYFAQNVQL